MAEQPENQPPQFGKDTAIKSSSFSFQAQAPTVPATAKASTKQPRTSAFQATSSSQASEAPAVESSDVDMTSSTFSFQAQASEVPATTKDSTKQPVPFDFQAASSSQASEAPTVETSDLDLTSSTFNFQVKPNSQVPKVPVINFTRPIRIPKNLKAPVFPSFNPTPSLIAVTSSSRGLNTATEAAQNQDSDAKDAQTNEDFHAWMEEQDAIEAAAAAKPVGTLPAKVEFKAQSGYVDKGYALPAAWSSNAPDGNDPHLFDQAAITRDTDNPVWTATTRSEIEAQAEPATTNSERPASDDENGIHLFDQAAIARDAADPVWTATTRSEIEALEAQAEAATLKTQAESAALEAQAEPVTTTSKQPTIDPEDQPLFDEAAFARDAANPLWTKGTRSILEAQASGSAAPSSSTNTSNAQPEVDLTDLDKFFDLALIAQSLPPEPGASSSSAPGPRRAPRSSAYRSSTVPRSSTIRNSSAAADVTEMDATATPVSTDPALARWMGDATAPVNRAPYFGNIPTPVFAPVADQYPSLEEQVQRLFDAAPPLSSSSSDMDIEDAAASTTPDAMNVEDAPVSTTPDAMNVEDAPVSTTPDAMNVEDAPVSTTPGVTEDANIDPLFFTPAFANPIPASTGSSTEPISATLHPTDAVSSDPILTTSGSSTEPVSATLHPTNAVSPDPVSHPLNDSDNDSLFSLFNEGAENEEATSPVSDAATSFNAADASSSAQTVSPISGSSILDPSDPAFKEPVKDEIEDPDEAFFAEMRAQVAKADADFGPSPSSRIVATDVSRDPVATASASNISNDPIDDDTLYDLLHDEVHGDNSSHPRPRTPDAVDMPVFGDPGVSSSVMLDFQDHLPGQSLIEPGENYPSFDVPTGSSPVVAPVLADSIITDSFSDMPDRPDLNPFVNESATEQNQALVMSSSSNFVPAPIFANPFVIAPVSGMLDLPASNPIFNGSAMDIDDFDRPASSDMPAAPVSANLGASAPASLFGDSDMDLDFGTLSTSNMVAAPVSRSYEQHMNIDNGFSMTPNSGMVTAPVSLVYEPNMDIDDSFSMAPSSNIVAAPVHSDSVAPASVSLPNILDMDLDDNHPVPDIPASSNAADTPTNLDEAEVIDIAPGDDLDSMFAAVLNDATSTQTSDETAKGQDAADPMIGTSNPTIAPFSSQDIATSSTESSANPIFAPISSQDIAIFSTDSFKNPRIAPISSRDIATSSAESSPSPSPTIAPISSQGFATSLTESSNHTQADDEAMNQLQAQWKSWQLEEPSHSHETSKVTEAKQDISDAQIDKRKELHSSELGDQVSNQSATEKMTLNVKDSEELDNTHEPSSSQKKSKDSQDARKLTSHPHEVRKMAEAKHSKELATAKAEHSKEPKAKHLPHTQIDENKEKSRQQVHHDALHQKDVQMAALKKEEEAQSQPTKLPEIKPNRKEALEMEEADRPQSARLPERKHNPLQKANEALLKKQALKIKDLEELLTAEREAQKSTISQKSHLEALGEKEAHHEAQLQERLQAQQTALEEEAYSRVHAYIETQMQPRLEAARTEWVAQANSDKQKELGQKDTAMNAERAQMEAKQSADIAAVKAQQQKELRRKDLEFRKTCDNLNERLDRARRSVEELQAHLRTQIGTTEALRRDLRAKEHDLLNKDMRLEIERREAKIGEGVLRSAQEDVKALKGLYNVALSDAKEREAALGQAESAVEELRGELTAEREEGWKLEKELETRLSEFASTEQGARVTNEELGQAQIELEELSAQKAGLTAQLDKLSAAVNEGEEERDKLKSRIEELEKDRAEEVAHYQGQGSIDDESMLSRPGSGAASPGLGVPIPGGATGIREVVSVEVVVVEPGPLPAKAMPSPLLWWVLAFIFVAVGVAAVGWGGGWGVGDPWRVSVMSLRAGGGCGTSVPEWLWGDPFLELSGSLFG